MIRPYAFVLAGRDWMVLAEDAAQAQVKNFYLARIESPRLTTERYAIPRTFDADVFFRNTFGLFVGKGRAFRFRVRFAPEVAVPAFISLVHHPGEKIETQPDGSAVLELPGESLREARRFILAYGRHAAALSPPELVADLEAETGAMAGLYTKASASEKAVSSAGRKKRATSRRSE